MLLSFLCLLFGIFDVLIGDLHQMLVSRWVHLTRKPPASRYPHPKYDFSPWPEYQCLWFNHDVTLLQWSEETGLVPVLCDAGLKKKDDENLYNDITRQRKLIW